MKISRDRRARNLYKAAEHLQFDAKLGRKHSEISAPDQCLLPKCMRSNNRRDAGRHEFNSAPCFF